MAKRNRIKGLVNKKKDVIKKNTPFEVGKIVEKLSPLQSKPPSKNADYQQSLDHMIKLLTLETIKRYSDFIKIARSEKKLSPLFKILDTKGIDPTVFFNKIEFDLLLNTYEGNLNGRFNEFLFLNDRGMMKLVKDRFEGAFKSLFNNSETIISGRIGNIKGKKFNMDDFKAQAVEIAYEFRTKIGEQPKGLQYVDIGLVLYNRVKNSLLIIPGEIKEPRAAKELRKQLAKFIDRLKNNDKVSFKIDGEEITLDTEDIFFMKEESMGLARRKEGLPAPIGGENVKISKSEVIKDLSLKEGILQTDFFININVDSKKTLDGREFFKFLCTRNPELDRIIPTLIQIKDDFNKIKMSN